MNLEERMYSLDIQKIDLKDLNADGKVLDIGGGGEGVIGQILGDKVIAIDPRADELLESAEGPLKIIMDARELKFLDNSIDIVTSFFSLMYIEKKDHQTVFEEICRTLKNSGRFLIWDAAIPDYDGGPKDIILVPLEIKALTRTITTTYGVSWVKAAQNINYFIKIAEKTGFSVISKKETGKTFYIELLKTNDA